MAAVEQQFTKDLTADTFTQVSTLEMIHDVRLTQRTLTFSLNDPIWHYTYNGSPIDFVGSKVTIKSVSLPDLALAFKRLRKVYRRKFRWEFLRLSSVFFLSSRL